MSFDKWNRKDDPVNVLCAYGLWVAALLHNGALAFWPQLLGQGVSANVSPLLFLVLVTTVAHRKKSIALLLGASLGAFIGGSFLSGSFSI